MTTHIKDFDRADGIVCGAMVVAVAVTASLANFGAASLASAETFQRVPAPAAERPDGIGGLEKAVFAGGCFWGVQGVFQHVEGVTQAVSGYSGGSNDTATYALVGSGATGHAESVEITYDPQQVSYGTLLQIFFSVAHDPTQVDRQGPDAGTQYRSAIFATNEAQADLAKAYVAQLDSAKVFPAPIATEIGHLEAFYPAEDYHQDYATLHPDSAYIAINDLPKIEALATIFPELYRAEPALVFAATQ